MVIFDVAVCTLALFSLSDLLLFNTNVERKNRLEYTQTLQMANCYEHCAGFEVLLKRGIFFLWGKK